VWGGYEFSPWLSLEAGLADLGHQRADGLKVKGRAAFLDAVGTAALTDQWSLLGRVGVARASLDTTAGDDRGSGLKLGLGAQYKVTSNIAVRGEWERYRPAVFGDKPNVDQWTLGVKYSF